MLVSQFANDLGQFTLDRVSDNEQVLETVQDNSAINHTISFDIDNVEYVIIIQSCAWFGQYEHSFTFASVTADVAFCEAVQLSELERTAQIFFSELAKVKPVI